jgi:hypothetical protein
MAWGRQASAGFEMVVNDVKGLSQVDSQILHPGTRKLYRYWEMIRAENAAPQRQALDLRTLKALIPNLAIIEQDHLRKSYKWRLAGMMACDVYRRALTGTDALACWDAFERKTVETLYGNVVTALQPCLLRFRLTTDEGATIGAEQIGLPLLAKNDARIHIFGGIFPFEDMRDKRHASITRVELFGARMIWTEHLPGDELVARMQNTRKKPQRLSVIRGGRQE